MLYVNILVDYFIFFNFFHLTARIIIEYIKKIDFGIYSISWVSMIVTFYPVSYHTVELYKYPLYESVVSPRLTSTSLVNSQVIKSSLDFQHVLSVIVFEITDTRISSQSESELWHKSNSNSNRKKSLQLTAKQCFKITACFWTINFDGVIEKCDHL